MSSNAKQQIESRGPTVEAAVAAGLLRLGLSRDQVDITVIDEGSRGLLGIGSREAVVIISRRSPPSEASTSTIPSGKRPTPATEAVPAAAPSRPEEPPLQPERPRRDTVDLAADDEDESQVPGSLEELESERETAVAVISELLDKMHVSAEVSAYLSEPDNLTGQRVNMIAIAGDDLGMLIGPRGETLDSLQFLSRLMVAHKLHRRVNFVVDVEGFRQRRVQALTRLAERMADKVRQRGEPIGLEPMSAYERRIIHMTLRDAQDVYTESTGEGKQRRVRIIPKR